LRDRKEDIPLLAEHFIQKYAEKNQQHIRKISPQVIDLFMRYSWPGNIRELENVIQRAVILCKEDTLIPDVLPATFKNLTNTQSRDSVDSLVGLSIKEVEKELVLRTLEQTNHNITRAAEILGITRRGLQYKLNELGIK